MFITGADWLSSVCFIQLKLFLPIRSQISLHAIGTMKLAEIFEAIEGYNVLFHIQYPTFPPYETTAGR